MFTLSALALVWFAVPVLAFLVLAVAPRFLAWDYRPSLATITHHDHHSANMERAVNEARIFFALAHRAQVVYGNPVRAESFRTMGRKAMAEAFAARSNLQVAR